jgi:threonine-phosphate decarboxylase
MGEEKLYDFSDISNPTGLRQEVRRAIEASADSCHQSTEAPEAELGEAISRYRRIPSAHICCGGGTTDLVYRILFAFRPRKALVTAPGWPQVEIALRQYGCQVDTCVLPEHEGFAPGASLKEMILSGAYDMVFLANPSYPTGGLMEKAYLTDLLYHCHRIGTRLVLDECFMELSMGSERYSLLPEAVGMNDLIVLRSFSVTFAMSGLRLGYAVCGNEEDARILREAANDRVISVPVYMAGMAVLQCGRVQDDTLVYIAMERERLVAKLLEAGLKVYPSQANFLLFQSAWDLGKYLSVLGVRLKEVTEDPGLCHIPGYFYIAGVRDREANRYLADCLVHAVREQRRSQP